MKSLNFSLRELVMLAIIGFLAFSWIKSYSSKQQLARQNNQLHEQLADTLKFFKNKDGDRVAQIAVIRMENSKSFLKLKTKDEEIKQLQKLVKDYQSKLKKPGSAVTHTTIITEVDTVTITEVDTVDKNPVYSFTFKNKWLEYKGISSRDSTRLQFKTYNEYATIIGFDRKQKKYFTDVINYNPYTSVKTTRTFQTTMPKKKQWNISIGAGYGIHEGGHGWHIGLYAGKTILRL